MAEKMSAEKIARLLDAVNESIRDGDAPNALFVSRSFYRELLMSHAALQSEADRLRANGEALRERIDELEEKLIEARQGPWPEWAEKLLRLLEEWGCEYDADDEINLPDELAEWLNGYAGELRRAASPAQPAQKTE